MPISNLWRRAGLVAAALLLLNAALTFGNIWPTPAIRWRPQISFELAVCLLAIALLGGRTRPASRVVIGGLSGLWILLALGHYADVTAPALYGREINLYWDLRFIPDVVSMITRVAPAWLIVLSAAGLILFVTLLYLILRWAWRQIAGAMARPPERRALVAVALLATAWFAVDRARATPPDESAFARPVVQTYGRQLRLVGRAMRSTTMLPVSPRMDSDLSAVRDADVFVVFVESYGAIAFDRPTLADRLAASRSAFAAAVRDTSRRVVSAFVESPTFGGGSWLAHISLLSGVEVRDPDTNALLMTERRETLVDAFKRQGFRTIALMPGLRQAWPEGRFYGFDVIYGADRLGYHGPEFGWFAIPDQFSLYRLDELELTRSPRPPLFVFFPTISTHFPFSPTPPYQPDWRRMPDAHPYDGPAIVRAYGRQPDWTDFGPGYVDAMTYDFATLAGYLRNHADRDFVMVVLGDHEPAAAVSGEGATWDVPVHLIASRPVVLDRLRARGFLDGMTPARPDIGHMHALLPVLLEAFGDGK